MTPASEEQEPNGPGCERHRGDPHNLCEVCWALEPDSSAGLLVPADTIEKAHSEFFSELEATLRAKWREHLDEADRSDDDGSHVGFARYHRNVARGLEEALAALAAVHAPKENEA